jgi:hypothetical protein
MLRDPARKVSSWENCIRPEKCRGRAFENDVEQAKKKHSVARVANPRLGFADVSELFRQFKSASGQYPDFCGSKQFRSYTQEVNSGAFNANNWKQGCD